jgi:hypothetical protein
MEEDKKWTNPFNQYVLKEFGRQHLNKFVRTVCSCGKKNNLQCKRRFCSSCCVASGEACVAHKQSDARKEKSHKRKAKGGVA